MSDAPEGLGEAEVPLGEGLALVPAAAKVFCLLAAAACVAAGVAAGVANGVAAGELPPAGRIAIQSSLAKKGSNGASTAVRCKFSPRQ